MGSDCLGCRIVGRAHRPAGGEILRTAHFVLHGVAAPSPVAGWVVLTAAEHVRGVYDVSEAAAAEVGALARRVMRAQREALGAEHVYLFALGDVLKHAHLHLVPRYADTPEHLWGRGVFDAAPEEHLGEAELEAAGERLRAALTSAGK